jgi:hypothetical protein
MGTACLFSPILYFKEVMMIWWVFFLTVLTILSYLADVGAWTFFHDLRIPFLNASILSVLLLLCTLGILVRMLMMKSRGEKEKLRQTVSRLERNSGSRAEAD